MLRILGLRICCCCFFNVERKKEFYYITSYKREAEIKLELVQIM